MDELFVDSEDEDDIEEDNEEDVSVKDEEEDTDDELESLGEIFLMSSSAVMGAIFTLGGDNGVNKSKS